MLTSLFKIVLFLMIVVAIAFGATYLMDGNNTIIGDLMITLGGVEYTLSAVYLTYTKFFNTSSYFRDRLQCSKCAW